MKSQIDAAMLFIAELTGSYVAGTGTEEDKIGFGKLDYITNRIPDIDLSIEADRKELHEVVWLERLYKDLDAYFCINQPDTTLRYLKLDTEAYRGSDDEFKWSVPVELDCGASMIQYIAVLLNDKRLMDMTNIIGDTLEDPWKLEGLSRLKLKKAATPMIYGSKATCHELWQDAGMKYTAEEVALYNEEMSNGAFGLCNMFKDFIINNAKPKAEMMVNINGEIFNVSCNRFKNVGEKTNAYKVWDSVDKRYNIVLHTDTKKIPDLDRFRTYLVTLLIHCLDSQICDTVTDKVMEKYGWCVPIYDAWVVSPDAALDVRMWYAEEMEKLHKNRKTILKNYFDSVGITAESQNQWNDLTAKIHQFEGELKVGLMALK